MHWQRERKACERKWGWEKQRGKVRARPDLSDNLQIPHKGKGTSETAGALGNNALPSFSFTSGPKRTWKPTTHTDKTSHCCYCRLPTWRIWGSAFYLQTPPCQKKKKKKPETNKTGTHLKKNPLISDNGMQNKEKYSELGKRLTYIKKTCETFSWELSQGQRGQKGREKSTIPPGERTSREVNEQEREKDWEKERRRGEQELDNWQRVEAAFTARQAAQLELKAPLRHNEDVAAN